MTHASIAYEEGTKLREQYSTALLAFCASEESPEESPEELPKDDRDLALLLKIKHDIIGEVTSYISKLFIEERKNR